MPKSKAIRDAKFSTTKYLPAAAATNYTDKFDLDAVDAGAEPNLFECELKVPAMPNHTDSAKIIAQRLQDSADGVTFAAVDPVIEVQTPGVAVNGSAARTVLFRVPSSTRRYIRIAQTVPAGDGDNTGALAEFNLLF